MSFCTVSIDSGFEESQRFIISFKLCNYFHLQPFLSICGVQSSTGATEYKSGRNSSLLCSVSILYSKMYVCTHMPSQGWTNKQMEIGSGEQCPMSRSN